MQVRWVTIKNNESLSRYSDPLERRVNNIAQEIRTSSTRATKNPQSLEPCGFRVGGGTGIEPVTPPCEETAVYIHKTESSATNRCKALYLQQIER
jgi:hypothetical protein